MNSRNTVVLILICTSAIGQGFNPRSGLQDFKVTEISVGVFKKGMTLKEALSLVPGKHYIKKAAQYEGTFYDDYEIYDSNNELLIIITPQYQDNANSLITSILIKDKRFQTEKGINTQSTYSDLTKAYHLDKISPDIEVVVLTIRELPAQFSINKKFLLKNWWIDSEKQIDTTKIPPAAPLDSFGIRWD